MSYKFACGKSYTRKDIGIEDITYLFTALIKHQYRILALSNVY